MEIGEEMYVTSHNITFALRMSFDPLHSLIRSTEMELESFIPPQNRYSKRDMRMFGYSKSVIHSTAQLSLRRQLCLLA